MARKELIAHCRTVLIAAVLALALRAGASAQPVLYGIDARNPILGVIDMNTAGTLSTQTITLAGNTVIGGNGLAVDPTTQQMWALLTLNGQSGRELVMLDPLTGAATDVGNTGDNFANIAFDAAGTLYGVTGDGASTPETLFTLDKGTGAPTSLLTLGRGTDGEMIAFNSADGLMYHGSGHTGTDVIFETIDLNSLATTDIPIGAPLTDEEAQALTWFNTGGYFFWKQGHFAPGPLFRVTPSGAATLIGDMDRQYKGLAIAGDVTAVVPEPSSLALLGCGLTALGTGLRRKRAK